MTMRIQVGSFLVLYGDAVTHLRLSSRRRKKRGSTVIFLSSNPDGIPEGPISAITRYLISVQYVSSRVFAFVKINS